MLIYKITNKINGKVYIGQTTRSLKTRWKEHYTNKSNCYALHRAVQKYGKENFEIKVIDHGHSREELDNKEIFWIQFYDSMNRNKGYNLTSGGETNKVMSEETRRKMSESKKGEKNPFYGKHHTEETKKEHSEAVRGYKHTEESRRRMSESRKGMSYSLERNLKISKSKIGHKVSQETREKLRKANLGKKQSKETIAKRVSKAKGEYNGNSKTVKCIETGEIFGCIKYACEKYKINPSTLSYGLKGASRTAAGYHWEYVK